MGGSTQENPYSVSSLTDELKGLVEGRFAKIFVEGEISGWRPAASGHVYFTLKDDGAQISAVMFRSSFERCKARAALKDGAKVMLYANASVYAPRGQYQLVVMAARPTGEGDLMQRYLELKARLEAEGLFAAQRKRSLPFMPRRIGVVTSPSGAVVHDICRVLMRRFPALEVRIFPALVQGAGAAGAVVAGLRHFAEAGDGWKADVVIVARGGGSFEDLFCFNDESLVRAVAASPIPVVSAVGHETDFTLCDFAADVRAGTPSMAAEIVVPVLADIRCKLDSATSTLAAALRGKYEWFAQRVDGLSDALVSSLREAGANARRRVETVAPRLESALTRREADARRRVETVAPRLESALTRREADARRRVEVLAAKLTLLSPFSVLERGYSLTTDADGRVVRAPSDVAAGDVITTRLRDGEVRSRVLK